MSRIILVTFVFVFCGFSQTIFDEITIKADQKFIENALVNTSKQNDFLDEGVKFNHRSLNLNFTKRLKNYSFTTGFTYVQSYLSETSSKDGKPIDKLNTGLMLNLGIDYKATDYLSLIIKSRIGLLNEKEDSFGNPLFTKKQAMDLVFYLKQKRLSKYQIT